MMTKQTWFDKFRYQQGDYYCLVAGLPELALSAEGGAALNAEALSDLKSQIQEGLTPTDAVAAQSIYLYYDILNLTAMLTGASVPFNSLGNLTAADLQQEIDAPVVDDEPFATRLPEPIALILDNYKDRLPSDGIVDEPEEKYRLEELENRLWGAFYLIASQSEAKFLRLWGAADRSMRNIIAASQARTLGLDPIAVMVGDGEIEQQITTSSASDFGLRGEFDYFDALWEVMATTDFVERERKLDALRWNITEDLTPNNFFDIDFILGYLVRLNLLLRWQNLDKAVGSERFKSMVEGFTADTKL